MLMLSYCCVKIYFGLALFSKTNILNLPANFCGPATSFTFQNLNPLPNLICFPAKKRLLFNNNARSNDSINTNATLYNTTRENLTFKLEGAIN
eukprot:snap_masked-scaffold_12-processed-gene-4.13-mRNA-1 protein AED:1.00 eAED:1.00 QI:0/0/0/0/1/1/7/0/92